MSRVLVVAISLFAVLTVIWFCWGNDLDALFAQEGQIFPQFHEQPTTPEPTKPALPDNCIVPGELICYDADGEEGVAALYLSNVSDDFVQVAEVMLQRGSRRLYFAAGYIPPGATVLVQEKYGARYSDAPTVDYSLVTLVILHDDMSVHIQVEQTEHLQLQIQNLSDTTLTDVRIFYREYDPLTYCYIGKDTYCLTLPQLLPGESKLVAPYLYDQKQMRLVAIISEKQ